MSIKGVTMKNFLIRYPAYQDIEFKIKIAFVEQNINSEILYSGNGYLLHPEHESKEILLVSFEFGINAATHAISSQFKFTASTFNLNDSEVYEVLTEAIIAGIERCCVKPELN